MSEILVIGGDSFIGAALTAKTMAAATSRRKNAGLLPLDAAKTPLILPDLPSAKVAFICTAISGEAACQADPELAILVNSTFPGRVARELSQRGMDTIFLSSSAAVNKLGLYGQTKYQGERNVLDAGGRVIRFSKIWSSGNSGILGDWHTRLSAGASIEAFRDQYISPLTLQAAVASLVQTISVPDSISQICAASSISYYDAALRIARKCGYAENKIKPVNSGRESAAGMTSSSWFSPPSPFDAIDCVITAATCAGQKSIGNDSYE